MTELSGLGKAESLIVLRATAQLGDPIDNASDWDAYERYLNELAADLDAVAALRAVVEALPKCDDCPKPATRARSLDGLHYACDEHATEPDWVPSDALPYAEALRALGKGGGA
jgi:hypothetical protein